MIGLKNAAHTTRFLGNFGTCFHCSAVYLCVCFPPVKEATHTPIDLHMFVFTKVDLPINRMIPQWESAYIHVYMKNAFSVYVYNYIHFFFACIRYDRHPNSPNTPFGNDNASLISNFPQILLWVLHFFCVPNVPRLLRVPSLH